MTTLSDYVGHTLKGVAYHCGIATPVTVTVTAVSDDALKVESEQEFCSQSAGIDDTAWVQPIGEDLDFGSAPFHGTSEEGDSELELDFWE